MAEMSMNKVIHAAIRRDLDRFIAALSTFRAGDRMRAQQLETAWANFDQQLTVHHEGEHAIAWPALESVGVSHDLLASLDAEHETMAAALAEARTAMSALAGSGSAEDAAAALAACRTLQAAAGGHLGHRGAGLGGGLQGERGTP